MHDISWTVTVRSQSTCRVNLKPGQQFAIGSLAGFGSPAGPQYCCEFQPLGQFLFIFLGSVVNRVQRHKRPFPIVWGGGNPSIRHSQRWPALDSCVKKLQAASDWQILPFEVENHGTLSGNSTRFRFQPFVQLQVSTSWLSWKQTDLADSGKYYCFA